MKLERIVTDDILVLRRRPYRDSSDLIEGVSRSSGRVAGVFSRSRRAASLDAPVLVRLKRNRGRNLETFSQPVIQKGYAGIRRDLGALMTAGFLGRLFLGCLPEREPNEAVFELLCELYDALEDGIEARVCGLWGQERLLQALGVAPHLAGCVMCGESQVVGFSAVEGGVLCRGCFQVAGIGFSGQDLVLARSLRERSLREVSEEMLTPAGVRLAGRIYKAQFQSHLELSSDYFKRVLPARKVEGS